MSRTESTMLALGTPAPAFKLPDVVTGVSITLDHFKDHAVFVVMFICRHCPYVKHVQDELARLGRDYADRSVGFLAVSSNDAAAYPDDAPEALREMALTLGFTFPFCYDESQDIARDYSAVCTPDFFVFDHDRKLAYRGQLDNSRRNSGIPVTGADVRAAIDALLARRPVNPEQRPSIGCNIKWRNS